MATYNSLSEGKKAIVLTTLIDKPALAGVDGAFPTGVNFVEENITAIPSQQTIRSLLNILSGRGLLDFTGRKLKANRINAAQLVALINGQGIIQSLPADVNFGSAVNARRETGWLRQEEKMQRTIDAVSDPEMYLKNQLNEVKQINDKALKTYNEAYDQFVSHGYKIEEAQKRAISAAQAYKSKLMEQHNIDFNPEMIKKVQDSLLKK